MKKIVFSLLSIVFLIGLINACATSYRAPANTTLSPAAQSALLGSNKMRNMREWMENSPRRASDSTLFAQAQGMTGAAHTSSKKDEEQVAVYLEGKAIKYIMQPTRDFKIKTLKDTKVLEQLGTYITGYQSLLEINADVDLQLRPVKVSKKNELVSVHFEQIVRRQVRTKDYIIPIATANIVALLKNNKLQSLNSNLANPPSLSLVMQNPGFDISALSAKEIGSLIRHIKEAPSKAKIRDYIQNLAENTGSSFNLNEFLKAPETQQAEMLKTFFAGIKKTSTAKMIIDLARAGRLSLVQYGSEWAFQVSQFFDLPVEFDIFIPSSAEQKLQIKNFREMYHPVNIHVYEQPDYPLGNPTLLVNASTAGKNTNPALRGGQAAAYMQEAARFFENNFGWHGYSGHDPNGAAQVKINLTGDKYAQNAYWTNHLNFILLGNGGSERSNYANSPSIIGHEFGHAIVYYSSGLKYESQSGALNEHFGDIMGVNLEAYVTGNPFDYTIGDEIITASASEGHRFMVDYILSSNAYTPQQAERYHLRKVALRNLYEPAISIYPQPKDMETANQLYGPLCQPSVDNDYCGVHYASGIPNRAAAMIIDTLGMERTRSLFFNTVTRRLGPNSNFQEYRRQLHEECLQAGDFNQNECAVILASFEKVGVGAAVKPPPPPPPPPPQTKALKYCGWLSVSATKNITVIDNKFDSVVLNVANKDKFGGVYTPISTNELNTLLGMHKGCGCVKGVLSQVQNSKGTWFNYLVLAHTVEKLATATCKNIEFK